MKSPATILCGILVAAVLPISFAVGQSESERVWTVSEILSERQPVNDVTNPSYCKGERYKPCVCAPDVSKLVQYRPAIAQCGNKAGAVFSGRYLNIFSVVVRDRLNRDRVPERAGFNGCSVAEYKAGLAKCSAFKVQKKFRVKNANGNAEVHCFGASGYSKLFQSVTRLTVKLKDVADGHSDPLERLCLAGPKKALN